jgi:hypothetical protein
MILRKSTPGNIVFRDAPNRFMFQHSERMDFGKCRDVAVAFPRDSARVGDVGVNDYDIRTYRAYLCDVAQRMKVCAMNHLESLRPEMLLVAPLLTISMFGDSKAASSFSSLTKNAKYVSAGRSLQRPKIWQAKMSASLRMMAALCPISTKEIDRIRGAQPTGWSARGIAWSCAVCRSVVINPPQKIRVALRFWAGRRQAVARSPASKRVFPHQGFLSFVLAPTRCASVSDLRWVSRECIGTLRMVCRTVRGRLGIVFVSCGHTFPCSYSRILVKTFHRTGRKTPCHDAHLVVPTVRRF